MCSVGAAVQQSATRHAGCCVLELGCTQEACRSAMQAAASRASTLAWKFGTKAGWLEFHGLALCCPCRCLPAVCAGQIHEAAALGVH